MKKTLSMILAAVLVAMMLTVIPVSSSAAGWDGTTATEFTGKGTAASPYIIASAENLKYLQKMVADGEDYRGEYFTQTADIDLNGKEWTPIGDSGMYFSGVYDGLGHSIKGLYISDGNINQVGLFGYIQSDFQNEAGIMNLKLYGEIKIDALEKDAGIGALCGWVYKDSDDHYMPQKIYNIENNVNFTINAQGKQPRFGAILGYCFNSEVYNCVNNGNIDYVGSAHTRIGGIVGQTNRTVYKNCINNGNLTATVSADASSQVAGISGMTTYKLANVYTEYDHCVNNGTITCISEKGACYGGGIAAALYTSATDLFMKINECVNNGAIHSKMTDSTVEGKYAYAGGICPRYNISTAEITKCVNTSLDITSEGALTGDLSAGIVSHITKDDAATIIVKDNVTVTPSVYALSAFEVAGNGGTSSATDKDIKTLSDPIMAEVNKEFKAVICDFPGDGKTEETEPVVTEPAKTEPVATEPVATEPVATEPVATDPVATAPVTTDKPADTKSGCGSVVGMGVALVAVLGCAVAFKKH